MSGGGILDILIIGGGVNGAAIARDAAGRGLSVLLAEAGDLAGATSSASTKLIHGGLRYLEHYEFRLVREALIEREVLLAAAPHIIWPLRFILPYAPHLRPRWMIGAGLFLYDRLGGRMSLPRSRRLALKHSPEGLPLKPEFDEGFAYSDCFVDDARLVVLNAIDAAERGARVLTRTKVMQARRDGGLWRVTLDQRGIRREEAARALVNAAGPWAEAVNATVEGPARPLRLVKGSHLVLPRLYLGDHAYLFQNPDGRIVFTIPYEGRFTLVGTTEVDFSGDPRSAHISDDEARYLADAVSGYFRKSFRPEEAIASFAGVRPLHDDLSVKASAATRDYALDLSGGAGEPPLLTVLGGKITTSRRLAEHALQKLAAPLRLEGKPWTARGALPGGDIEGGDFSRFLEAFTRRHPWLPADLAFDLARRHGTRADVLLEGKGSLKDLGEEVCPSLYEAEIDYLRSREWAVTADDILWRRTKLGLHAGADAGERLTAWLARG